MRPKKLKNLLQTIKPLSKKDILFNMNEIPKNNPFKLPKNYLEDFEVSITETKARSAFKTPDNYFDEFKVELPKEKKEPELIQLIKSYKIAAIAAAITLLIAVPLLLNTNNSTAVGANQLSFQDIDSYLMSTQNPYDHYELANDFTSSTTELDFLASNETAIEAYIDLQLEEFSEYNLYYDEY